MQHPLSWQSLVELIICFENARESVLGLDKKISLCLFTSQKIVLTVPYTETENKKGKKNTKGMEMSPECAKHGNANV